MNSDLKSILISQEEISTRVKEMGKEITEEYRGKELLLVGILKGSVVFMADLMRTIDLPLNIDFMAVSSYGNGVNTTGSVKILKDLDRSLEGKNILIVEDILDSGMTLAYLKNLLAARGPASIKIATLLDKPERRKTNVSVDYCGFSIPDEFVVGYGLDYAEQYRNLPYLGVLSPSAILG